MSKLPEILGRGLDPKEKEEFLRLLQNSALIRRIEEVLDEWIRAESSVPKDDYDSPSWSHKQADRNGSLRAYNKVKQLLDHKETK